MRRVFSLSVLIFSQRPSRSLPAQPAQLNAEPVYPGLNHCPGSAKLFETINYDGLVKSLRSDFADL